MNNVGLNSLMPLTKAETILKSIPTADIDQNVFIINFQWEESARFLLIKALMKFRIRIKKQIIKQKQLRELSMKLEGVIQMKKNPTVQ